MLLPQVAGLNPEFLSARLDGKLVGSAAIIWETWSEPAGFPVVVHVLPQARRRGIGRRLIEQVKDVVNAETPGLWTLGTIGSDAATTSFLQACGFEVERRQLHFRVDGAKFHAEIAGLLDRLRRRRRVPESAKTVPLESASLEAVAKLIAVEFKRSPLQMLDRLHRSKSDPNGFDLKRSVAVFDGPDLAGALLSRWQDGYPIIDAQVIAQPWRKGWANALLLETATRIGLEGGATHFQFRCDEELRDSTNLAFRGAGEQVASEAQFYYAIT